MYRVGPLPFGTTRASLQKAAQGWQWESRPGHPAGQTADRSGIYWTMQSATDPPNWVYTMEHGDVLITRTGQAKQPEHELRTAPVASSKTIRHLAASSSTKQNPVDLVFENDPWAKPQSAQKPISMQQLATIEATVQRNVMEAIKTKVEDKEMEVDDGPDRIRALEAHVAALQDGLKTVQSDVKQVHDNQQQITKQLANKMQSIEQKVDQGQANTQSLIDGKLNEHMERIEALMLQRDAKMAKTGGE